MCNNIPNSALLIEPFYGGSHKQLIDLLAENIPNCKTATLPAKKWHWRARTAAVYFSQNLPHLENIRVLFASSTLNLAELVALRPELHHMKKVLYFHENQLVYPVRKEQERDFQFGYNQILSSLVADVVVFNSAFNMESFLSNIHSFMKLMPEPRPKGLEEKIRPKCRVLYFPLQFPDQAESHCQMEKSIYSEDEVAVATEQDQSQDTLIYDSTQIGGANDQKMNSGDTDTNLRQTFKLIGKCEMQNATQQPTQEVTKLPCQPQISLLTEQGDDRQLHIVWAHRWEHDKDPETFFEVIKRLHDEGLSFSLSVMGEQYEEIPDIFIKSKDFLEGHIKTWGYQSSKSQYFDVLRSADCAVSTALHEFFGVAMIEAVFCGCYPLCPNRLVYPEIFPAWK